MLQRRSSLLAMFFVDVVDRFWALQAGFLAQHELHNTYVICSKASSVKSILGMSTPMTRVGAILYGTH